MQEQRRWSRFVLVVVLAFHGVAYAQSDPAPHNDDWRLALHLGGFVSDGPGGMVFGASALRRWRFIEAGAVAEWGGQFISDNTLGVAGAFGVTTDIAPAIVIDALAVLGVRHHAGVGHQFLEDDPGAEATLGYTGVTWGLYYLARGRPDRPMHGMFGIRAGFDHDLARVTRRYTFQDHDLNIFGPDETTIETRERKVGMTRAMVMLTAGLFVR